MNAHIPQKQFRWLLTLILVTGVLSLVGCVAPAWQQREAARSLTSAWEKVDFTVERQTAILQSFGCSDIKLTDPKTFLEMVQGKNCTVLGEKIPLMWTSKFPATVAFSDFCPPHGKTADASQEDVGRQVMARLNTRLSELSAQVFEGKAEGRFGNLTSGPTGNQVCSFKLRPNFN